VNLSDDQFQLFELAYTLGISYEEVADMPYDTFKGWLLYFESRPVGWREDLRTFYIVSAFGGKMKPGDLFPSLAQMEAASRPKNPVANLKNSYLFSKMLTAKGGDKIPED
jgi:hypothetical protein